MPEKKKRQIRNGKAVQAHDATTTQQIKAAWSNAPLGSQKRPPLPRKKAFSAAKTNAAFDAYYRGHVVPEEEWVRFLEVMRSPLPTTFSFTNCSGQLDAALVQAHPSLGDGADFMLCEAETNREVQRGTFTPEQAMAMPSPGRFTLLFNAVQVQVQVQAAAADT